MALYETKFRYKSDYYLNLENSNNKFMKVLKRFIFLLFAICKFNVFHFYFGESLLPNNLDLRILRLFKKKMVMNYCGSEIRIPDIIQKRNKYYINTYNENSNNNINKMKNIAKYIDYAIVTNPELIEYVKPYYKRSTIVNVIVPYANHSMVNKNINTIIVCHAPTDRIYKGTNIVIDCINKLQIKYDVELLIIENKNYSEAIEIFNKCDLVIDQLRHGIYGTVSIEAMSLGKPVICYISDYIIKRYPKELPIINANPDNLYSVLEKLLKNPHDLQKYSNKSKEYFEKYHSPDVIGKQLIKIYKSL
jgi:glycosyltransferase involved in cell wall biosynthesis